MSGRAFLFISPIFSPVVALTSPPVLGALVQAKASPIARSMANPFGQRPAATLPGGGRWAVAHSLPTPSLSELPPTFTPIPPRLFAAAPEATTSPAAARVTGASPAAETLIGGVTIPASPALVGAPPDQRAISLSVLDAPAERVAGHLPFGHARHEASMATGLRASLIWSVQENV
jgi:hypothetical protein